MTLHHEVTLAPADRKRCEEVAGVIVTRMRGIELALVAVGFCILVAAMVSRSKGE